MSKAFQISRSPIYAPLFLCIASHNLLRQCRVIVYRASTSCVVEGMTTESEEYLSEEGQNISVT